MKIMGKRIGAYIVDLVLVTCLVQIFLFAYRVFLLDPQTAYRANYMLLCAILSVFFLLVYLPKKNQGQTIGKMLFHLRVMNENGTTRSWMQVLLRECILKFSFLMFLIPLDVVYTAIESIKARKLVLCVGHDVLLQTKVI